MKFKGEIFSDDLSMKGTDFIGITILKRELLQIFPVYGFFKL